MTKWTVIGGAIVNYFSCLEYSWEMFVSDAYGRVGLVVFQEDIITRLVFLDEVVFQQKRILFSLYDDITDVRYLADEQSCLAIRMIPIEIGRDSSFQIFCLSNINYGVLWVAPHINSARGRCFQCSFMKNFSIHTKTII